MRFNLTKYQRTQEMILDPVLQSLSSFEDDGNIAKIIASYLGVIPTKHTLVRPVHDIDGYVPDIITSCCISSTDELIATGNDSRTVHIFATVTGELLHWCFGHTFRVRCCCFSSDDEYVISGSDDRTLRMWNTSTGDCVHTFVKHTEAVRACCVSSTDTFMVSLSVDNTLKMWDIRSGTCLQTVNGHLGYGSHVSFCCISSADDFIVSSKNDRSIKVLDVATGACTKTHSFKNYLKACYISSTNEIIVAVTNADNTQLTVGNATTGKCICIHPLSDFDGKIWAMSCEFSNDKQRIAVSDNNGRLHTINIKTGEIKTAKSITRFPPGMVVCWTSNDQFLVCGTQNGIKIFEADTLELFSPTPSPEAERITPLSHTDRAKMKWLILSTVFLTAAIFIRAFMGTLE